MYWYSSWLLNKCKHVDSCNILHPKYSHSQRPIIWRNASTDPKCDNSDNIVKSSPLNECTCVGTTVRFIYAQVAEVSQELRIFRLQKVTTVAEHQMKLPCDSTLLSDELKK